MIVPHYEGKVRKIVITPARIYTTILVVAIFLATFASLAFSYGNMSKKVAQINVMGGDPVTADAQVQELQILQNTIAKQKAELDALKTYVVSLSKLENQVRSSLKLGPSTVTLESLLAQAPKSATLQSFTDVPKTVAQFLTEESDTTQIAQDKQKLLTDLNTAATTLNIKLAETPNIWPLQGYISSPFGWRSNPFGGGGYEFHTGIDIVAYYGAPIRAAADGTVEDAGWNSGGYGIWVKMYHRDEIETIYGHLSQVIVKAGDKVKKGQVIGYEGATGEATGPHLHFEIRESGTPVDPLTYLP
ncbi:MAG: peptidoglycan DD-metalloendopeptidase family protein [Caldisericaceae bacterium]